MFLLDSVIVLLLQIFMSSGVLANFPKGLRVKHL